MNGDRPGEDARPPPAVTVVVPVHNVAPYLHACLDSVLGQSLPDLEVIGVDDGSTDGSPGILREYAARDGRLAVLTQENRGPAAARNAGLDRARGRYVYFLDADDALADQALPVMLAAAEARRADVLCFDGTTEFATPALAEAQSRFRDYYRRLGRYDGTTAGPGLFAAMRNNGDYRTSPCLLFLRREWLAAVGLRFREGILHEDCLFTFLALLQARRAAHIPAALFVRRIRPDSIMTRPPDVRNFAGRRTCVAAMLEFVAGQDWEPDVLTAALAEMQMMLCNLADTYAVLAPEDRAAADALLADESGWGCAPARVWGRLAWAAAREGQAHAQKLVEVRAGRAEDVRRLRHVHEEYVRHLREMQAEKERNLLAAQAERARTEQERAKQERAERTRAERARAAEQARARLAGLQAAHRLEIRKAREIYERSLSWQLTAPLRWLGGWWKSGHGQWQDDRTRRDRRSS